MPRLRGRGRAFVAAALFAVAALCVAPVAVDALHEDQLGSFDWHTEYLGRVAHAAFAWSKTKQRAFVASEEGAIGALDAKTGCLLYTSPSPRDRQKSRMPSSA